MKAQLFFSLTLSTLLFACQKDPSSITDSTSPQGKTSSVDPDSNAKDSLSSDAVKYIAYMLDSSLISEEEAILNLNNFMQRNSSKGRYAEKTIASIRPIYLNGSAKFNDKFDPTVAYTVEYSNKQGFAIVAADRRIAPIICVIEDGSLADAYSVPGLGNLMNNINDYIKYKIDKFNKTRDSIKESLANLLILESKYTDITGKPLDEKPPLIVSPPDEGALRPLIDRNELVYEASVWAEKGRVDPMVPVNWDQKSPYNNYVDVFYCDHFRVSRRGAAGCVAIAMAQIMAYHKKPTVYKNFNYDWSMMTKTPIVDKNDQNKSHQVANLVRTIGSEVDMNYGCCASGASNRNVGPAFARMGYNTPRRAIPYAINDVKLSLRDGSPVYISGATDDSYTNGHAWVLDGYVFYEYYIYCYHIFKNQFGEIVKERIGRGSVQHNIVHCNWGWNQHNGFFDSECLSYTRPQTPSPKSEDALYDSFLSILCNIH